MSMITFEEDEFTFEVQEGEKLDFYNERRVYAAEMTANSKGALDTLAQSQDDLIRQITNTKEKELVMTELQFESMEPSPRTPKNGDEMSVHNVFRTKMMDKSSKSAAL